MWKPRPEDSIDTHTHTHIHIQMGIKSQKAPTQSLTCLRCRAQWFAYVNAFGYGGIFRLLRSSLLCLSLSLILFPSRTYMSPNECAHISNQYIGVGSVISVCGYFMNGWYGVYCTIEKRLAILLFVSATVKNVGFSLCIVSSVNEWKHFKHLNERRCKLESVSFSYVIVIGVLLYL